MKTDNKISFGSVILHRNVKAGMLKKLNPESIYRVNMGSKKRPKDVFDVLEFTKKDLDKWKERETAWPNRNALIEWCWAWGIYKRAQKRAGAFAYQKKIFG